MLKHSSTLGIWPLCPEINEMLSKVTELSKVMEQMTQSELGLENLTHFSGWRVSECKQGRGDPGLGLEQGMDN